MPSRAETSSTVVFDAYWWDEGPAAVRHVMREIVLEWRTQFPADRMILVCRRGSREGILRDLGRDNVIVRETRLRPHGLAVAIAATLARRRYRATWAFNHNFAPIGQGSAVFLHDLLFLDHPRWFTPLERAYFSLMAPLARRAAVVMTSSRSEAERITRHLDRMVTAVGIGLSEELLESNPAKPAAMQHIDDYVLTVGRLNARKNLGTVISAALASSQITPQRPLVVVGEADGARADLPRLQGADRSRVLLLGKVSDGELNWLYSHATLSVMLSLGEGFGMPPLESLAFGSPVVVSDIPVFRETLSNHATFVDPSDVPAATRAIDDLLFLGRSDDEIARARSHALSMRWAQTVSDIRRNILEEPG